MKIIKPNAELNEIERKELEKKLREEDRARLMHEKWLRSQYFTYVMQIIDEAIDKADSIDLIPEDATVEEMGKFLMIAKLSKKQIQAIKTRLS